MHLKSPVTLSLFLGIGILCTSVARQIKVTPANPNHHIFHDQVVSLGWQGDITITSDFPVSSLRYNDNQYLWGGTPIGENEMVVAVISDCSEEQLGGKPTVTYDYYETEEEGVKPYLIRSVQISMSTNENDGNHSTTTNTTSSTMTADIDDLSFLDTSLFQASWGYESYWCNWNYYNNENFNEDPSEISKSAIQDETIKNEMPQQRQDMSAAAARGKKRGLIPTMTAVLLGIALLSGGASAGESRSRFFFCILATSIAVLMVHGLSQNDDATPLGNNTTNKVNTTTTTAETMMCKINVEILHDGCRFDPLSVLAPAARVGDVVLQDQQSESPEEGCTTYYSANLTFPETETKIVPVDSATGEHLELPQLYRDQCYRMVEGRPFIDQSGAQIQATASSKGGNNNNGWCTTMDSSRPDNTRSNRHHQQQEQKQQRQALGQEWTRRALGEHASVSSFAAFTIALMSNNAPPQPIQDSITAAADEVRHAKVSFEAASLFLGQPVEPGPLPASSHKFEQDLQALALATAQEGCIDETLSALLAASEVDEQLNQQQQQSITEEERQWLKDQMWTIALEEASHSALAWRTIQWICDQDSVACEAVKSTVFDPNHLQAAVQNRLEGGPFSLEKAQMAWEQIHSALIPLVTENNKAVSSVHHREGEEENLLLTELVPRKIIEGVVGSLEVVSH